MRTSVLRFELTYEERATWGLCATCGAGHGDRCHPEVGPALGQTVDGRRPADGVHLGRLQGAPFWVQLVPAPETT